MSALTQARVRELLSYDPDSGVVRWRISRGCVKAGSIAGFEGSGGYLNIRIDGEQHRLHRVIFLYAFGRWPDITDHIYGVRKDNRLAYLIETTSTGNNRNARRHGHNTSGIAGVFWNSGKKRWTAKIKVDRRSIHLGHFADINDAAAARKQAEHRYGFSATHGRA